MCKLYLFNPESDLALGNGNENYDPPASALKMAEDLALLPAWYADKGSKVLIPTAHESYFYELKERGFLQDIFPSTHSSFSRDELSQISPWGWNPRLIKQLGLLGISSSLLPNEEEMNKIRELSRRSLAVKLLKELNEQGEYCGTSIELRTEQEVEEFVTSQEECVLKAPWSGSGKGLFWCRGEYTYFINRWSKRILKAQGGIVGEPLYNKVKDFAMEFRADGKGEIYFIGYSLFETDSHGTYKGNILASDKEIENRLSTYVSQEQLHKLKVKLVDKLSALLGATYQGYLGVDMMLCECKTTPKLRIHPCVEINLRMNMGIVAHNIYERYGRTGRFVIDYFPNPADLLKDHQERMQSSSLTGGYLSLTAVNENTNYRASIY
ncbi:MAG: hypothetical protein RRY36_03750 [Bacteroidaceae bacterium]